MVGEEHSPNAALSSEHSNVAGVTVEWNVNVAEVSETVPTGPESITVSGVTAGSESRTTCGSWSDSWSENSLFTCTAS